MDLRKERTSLKPSHRIPGRRRIVLGLDPTEAEFSPDFGLGFFIRLFCLFLTGHPN